MSVPRTNARCTIIYYGDIDSNHNIIEIRRKIRKLPDAGKVAERDLEIAHATSGGVHNEARNVRDREER